MSHDESSTTAVAEADSPDSEQEVVRPTRQHWKARATSLYSSRNAAREGQLAMLKAKQVEQFRELLSNLLNIEVEPDDIRMNLDGVQFAGRFQPGHPAELDVEYPCPVCNKTTAHRVRGLADIGAIIAGKGEPHAECHPDHVVADDNEDTPETRLLDALAEFIKANCPAAPTSAR